MEVIIRNCLDILPLALLINPTTGDHHMYVGVVIARAPSCLDHCYHPNLQLSSRGATHYCGQGRHPRFGQLNEYAWTLVNVAAQLFWHSEDLMAIVDSGKERLPHLLYPINDV